MSLDNIQGNPKFVNTRYFREAALDFKKNKGRYTKAPIRSKEWWDYWEEQERRCLHGYKVGGVKVTGKHYFYMNFTQLKKVDDNLKGAKVAAKEPDFPSFWEIDYDWFWYKEIAWHGCTKEQLKRLHLWKNPSPNEDGSIGGGMHLGCLKTRRGGFSYKEGADGVYIYNFIPQSKSYYFASIEDYLTKDGILNKVQYDLEFLNQNTDGFWLKNRMEKNTLMHQKASYIDDKKNIRGFQSEIIGVIVNDPDKVRGKDGIKVTCEEAGSFKHLKKTLAIILPSVSEGATLTGQISVFGTGGEEQGVDIEGLEDVFMNPRLYRMLPFENNWEEGYEATECGVFVPCYMVNSSFMDLEGNVDIKAASDFEDSKRAILKTSKDSKDLDRRIAENPKVPTEALLRVNSNIFPKADLLLQKNRILRSKELMGMILHGDIANEGGKGWQFVMREDAKPILHWPHKNDDDIRGCVTMIEAPQKAAIRIGNTIVNKVPDGVYKIHVDPYYKDEPKGEISTISLGAIYVTKTTSLYFSNRTDIDVCWFVGRPGRTKEFTRILFGLSEMYNAPIQSEIGGGGQGIVDEAREQRKLNRLEYEPIYINEKEIEKISKNRSYFMDISKEDKRLYLLYYADDLKTPVGLDENGHEILKLHYVYDLGLIEECLKYNDTGNFDRISAQLIKTAMRRERQQEAIKKGSERRKNSILDGNRVLFNGRPKGQDLLLLGNDGEIITNI